MNRLLVRATEHMEHFVKIDVGEILTKQIVDCYSNGTKEQLKALMQPIIDKHGTPTSTSFEVDFVGFE